MDILSDQDIEQLLRAINPYADFGSCDYTIVVMILDTTMRAMEGVDGKSSALNTRRRKLRIIGKGQNERTAPFGQRRVKVLLKSVHAVQPKPNPDDCGRLFVSLGDMPLTRRR